MTTQTLRGLAKDYATGAIDKEQYRKSRGDLIKGIIAGEVIVEPINFLPPLKPATDDDISTKTIERDRTEIKPQKPQPKPEARENRPKAKPSLTETPSAIPEKKSPGLFIAISTITVIILIIAVVLFYPKPPGTKTETLVQTIRNDEEMTNLSKAGEDLIAQFLSEKNWSEESLDKFVTDWTTLNAEERLSASQTKRMQRMTSSIYKQFLEEKALANIDEEKAIMKQQKLIEFAKAIGINDPRLMIEQ